MKYIYCFVLLLTSCATAKWKHKYFDTHFKALTKKYNIGEYVSIGNTNIKLTAKTYDDLTRKDVKYNLKVFELYFSLMPDSISIFNNKIDSFYTNQNKIEYIKKKSLQSKNMHFFTLVHDTRNERRE